MNERLNYNLETNWKQIWLKSFFNIIDRKELQLKLRSRIREHPVYCSILVIGPRAISINCRRIICGRRSSPNSLIPHFGCAHSSVCAIIESRGAQRNRLIPDYPNRKMALALVLSRCGPICARLDNESRHSDGGNHNYYVDRGARARKRVFHMRDADVFFDEFEVFAERKFKRQPNYGVKSFRWIKLQLTTKLYFQSISKGVYFDRNLV